MEEFFGARHEMLETELSGFRKSRHISCYGDPMSRNTFLMPTCSYIEDAVFVGRSLKKLCGHSDWSIFAIPVQSQDRDLTPWEGPMPYGTGEGKGSRTLNYILKKVIPYIEEKFPAQGRRYFLYGDWYEGMFCLWCTYKTNVFMGVAAVKPALWYSGWEDFIINNKPKAERIHLNYYCELEADKYDRVAIDIMQKLHDSLPESTKCEVVCSIGSEKENDYNGHKRYVRDNDKEAMGLVWLMDN